MKKKLLLILFTFALSLGIFGASFSLDSFASEVGLTPLTFDDNGQPCAVYTFGQRVDSMYPDLSKQISVPFALYEESSGNIIMIFKPYSFGGVVRLSRNNSVFGGGNSLSSVNLTASFGVSRSSISHYIFLNSRDALNALNNWTPSSYDESIVIKNYNAYWLGGLNSVAPVLSGTVSDNVDHINVELYWDDLDSSPIASYTINPVLGKFFNFGASVPYIGMQGHKMIYKLVPYSVSGNYGSTYYSTVTSFNLNNTHYVDVPLATGTGTGRLDFNSYTQSVNSYSPTNNISTAIHTDTTYNRTYNIDQSTPQEFYETYDYSTVDKSYFSNNDLTFNTNIEINFPQLDGDWLKNLFQTFNFNLPTDLMNHWIPGVPNWVIDIIIAGIAIIVAAVIAKLLFTIL